MLNKFWCENNIAGFFHHLISFARYEISKFDKFVFKYLSNPDVLNIMAFFRVFFLPFVK